MEIGGSRGPPIFFLELRDGRRSDKDNFIGYRGYIFLWDVCWGMFFDVIFMIMFWIGWRDPDFTGKKKH